MSAINRMGAAPLEQRMMGMHLSMVEHLCRLLYLVAACLLLLTSLLPRPVMAEECARPFVKPVIKLETTSSEVAYDAREGLTALTKKAAADKALPATGKIYSMGLTAAQWKSDAKLELTGRPLDRDTYCWSVVSLSMRFKLDTTVFIAKEIPRGSCAWKQVVDHEHKHVNLDRKLLAGLDVMVRPKIEPALRKTVVAKDGKKALAILQADARAAINRALKDFIAHREKQQLSKIDTPAEYQRVDDACSDAEWAAIFKKAGLQ